MSKARKGLAILGVASAMAFTGPAWAQDTGFYAGLSFGQSSVDVDCTGFSSCDDSDTAWKVFGGYQFNRNFAVEFGYTDLGEASASAPGASATAESTAFEVSAVGMLPLADRFSIFGRIGLHMSDTDARATLGSVSGSTSESNTGLTFGIGARYDFTKNLGVRAEWQRYADVGGDDVGGEFDVDVISIGVIWKF